MDAGVPRTAANAQFKAAGRLAETYQHSLCCLDMCAPGFVLRTAGQIEISQRAGGHTGGGDAVFCYDHRGLLNCIVWNSTTRSSLAHRQKLIGHFCMLRCRKQDIAAIDPAVSALSSAGSAEADAMARKRSSPFSLHQPTGPGRGKSCSTSKHLL
jgi:hypothetical protein